MAKERQSLRAKHAQKRAQDKARRRQNYFLITIGAVAAVSLLVWMNRLVIEYPDPEDVPATADGLAWGSPDAPILIEEFSDFQ
ncbi:MAG: hypothetical protein FVQ83_13370 [Chloroflexi bacterium]|nr:hypothetical protein [Chloroflexota bacterium]